MIPLLFRIGPIPVYSFGLMMALAFFVAGIVMQRDFERKGEPRDLAWSIVGYAVVGGIVGARLTLAAHNWPAFAADPLGFLLSQSGFVWYGGLLGGVIATAWPIRRSGVLWASAADTAAPALALGLAIGRIGCHLAGDGDWGTPTTLPWGVAYSHGVAPWPHPASVRVHPAPLYEMAALGVIFAVLWTLRTRVEPPGTLFCLYLLLTALTRLLVEFVRTNAPIFLGLTAPQWISIVLAAGAAIWLRRHARGSTPHRGVRAHGRQASRAARRRGRH